MSINESFEKFFIRNINAKICDNKLALRIPLASKIGPRIKHNIRLDVAIIKVKIKLEYSQPVPRLKMNAGTPIRLKNKVREMKTE